MKATILAMENSTPTTPMVSPARDLMVVRVARGRRDMVVMAAAVVDGSHEPEGSGEWEPEHEPEWSAPESDDYYVYGKSGKGSKGSKGYGYGSGDGHSDWSARESYSYQGKSGKGSKGSKGYGYGSGDGHYYEPEPEPGWYGNSGSGDWGWDGDGYQ